MADIPTLKTGNRISLLIAAIFAALWWLWAWDSSSHHVAPGLLDDGAHISLATRYLDGNFFSTVWTNFKEVFDPASRRRFYELQSALLGLYANAYGLDLRYWYLSNFALCFLTAIAALYIAASLTKSRLASVVAFIGVLTVSPLADAARANFGKVEVVMTAAFMVGLAALVGAWSRFQLARSAGGVVAVVLLSAGGVVFLTAGALGKESGKILATLLLLIPAFCWIGIWLKRKVSFFSSSASEADEHSKNPPTAVLIGCLVFGAAILAFTSYVFRERSDTGYLADYFRLNFDWPFLLRNLNFYLFQNPDFFILLAAGTPAVVFGLTRNVKGWAFVLSLGLVAAVYMLLLFTFRFQIPYYVYVPAVFAVVGFALAISMVPRSLQIVLLIMFVATRAHSLPYIYYQAAAQRYADFVNLEAMRTAEALGAPKVVQLDNEERNQLIQEWNLLKWHFFQNRLPPLYGAAPDFRAWEYQQKIRDTPPRPRSGLDGSGYLTGILKRPDNATAEPQVGDLVAIRVGTMSAGRIVLRAVLPFAGNEGTGLSSIDRSSLQLVAVVDGKNLALTPPCECGFAKFDYGWHFYRVVSAPKYFLFGRDPGGWLPRDSMLDIREAVPGAKLSMTLDLPPYVPFQFPAQLTITRGGIELATIPLPESRRYVVDVPLDKSGQISIRLGNCPEPSRASGSRCYFLPQAVEQRQ